MDPQNAKLADLYIRQGLSLAVVGRHFGRGQTWTRARLVEAGIKIRPMTNNRTRPAAEHVRALLDGGWLVAEIASQLSCSVTTVHKVMAEHGWEPPPRRPGGRRPPVPPRLSRDRLVELAASGMDSKAIAEELGISALKAARAVSVVRVRQERRSVE